MRQHENLSQFAILGEVLMLELASGQMPCYRRDRSRKAASCSYMKSMASATMWLRSRSRMLERRSTPKLPSRPRMTSDISSTDAPHIQDASARRQIPPLDLYSDRRDEVGEELRCRMPALMSSRLSTALWSAEHADVEERADVERLSDPSRPKAHPSRTLAASAMLCLDPRR